MSHATNVSANVKKCSFLRSVSNVVLTAIGVGIIGLPEVFAKCGWIGGFLVLTIGCLVSHYTTSKLYYALVSHPSGTIASSYEDLAQQYLGKPGKVSIALSMQITLIGVCAVLLLLLSQQVASISHWPLGKHMSILVCAACLWPLAMLKNLHAISYVSAVGLVGIFGLVGVIITAGVIETTADEYSDSTVLFRFDPVDFGASAATCALSFCVATVVATLVREMEQPADFPKINATSHLVSYVLYASLSSAAYLGWGASLVDGTVIDKLAGTGWVSLICSVCVIAMTVPHFLVLLLPVSESSEALLFLQPVVDPRAASADSVKAMLAEQRALESKWHRRPLLRRVIVRTGLLAVVAAIVCAVTNVKTIIGVVASVMIVFIAILMPLILTLCRGPRSIPEYVAISICGLFGLYIAVSGTYSAVSQALL